ncbi:hypothetical protein [Wolbachia endosymbiont of Ceratosolen solmsi]|uniref:hypothetical protein n=1 Tax=Wolbachia endosymbiont of Ceratosolen solmsi TaxID=497299 RepID=UPI0004994F46|nr:hypothetical protein [Wolbachia endosymbiont of Ceratosolen solmsi]AGK87107.1 hypothetical protein wSo0014 [Wolbachia endosymbiont of Ceratosolen solmsi]
MKTPKKIWKSIAKKFKNSTAAKANVSSSADKDILEEGKKLSEEVLNKEVTIKQQVVTGKTESVSLIQDTASIIGNIETPADAYENSNKSSLEEFIEHKPCENSNESNTIAIEHIATSIEKLDNTGICEKNETAVTETDIQEQNASNSLSSAACFDNGSSKENTADKKEKPSMQQRQAILAGVVGAALLVSSIIAYLLKMYAIAVIGGIVGLACVSYALYSVLKPNTKLEKVEEQSITAHPHLNPT